MLNVISLVTRRYLLSWKQEQSISTMMCISFASIALGTFSLALVFAIMNGFEKATHEKLRSVNPEILISAPDGQVFDPQVVKNAMTNDVENIVEAWSPTCTKHAIVKDDNGYNILILKGIDPKTESSVTPIRSRIILPETENQDLSSFFTSHNVVLIGKGLAKNLEKNPGDTIQLYYSADGGITNNRVKLDETTVTIGGIFDTGADEYDSNAAICSVELLEQLFPGSGNENLGIKLKNNVNETTAIKALEDNLGVEAHSWKDFYPSLVSALTLEKYASFIVILLISLVASANLMALMFMVVRQKRADAAILQAIGIPAIAVERIFMALALCVSAIAAATGLIIAIATCRAIDSYKLIKLPDAYYVAHLPASMEWYVPVAIFLIFMAFASVSAWIPIRSLRRSSITQILRREA